GPSWCRRYVSIVITLWRLACLQRLCMLPPERWKDVGGQPLELVVLVEHRVEQQQVHACPVQVAQPGEAVAGEADDGHRAGQGSAAVVCGEPGPGTYPS